MLQLKVLVMLQDVPSILFNIREAAAELAITRDARLVRARAMSPVLLGDLCIPVTVLPNPVITATIGSPGINHHSVVMHDPTNRTRKVKLFFTDTDWYFDGFQRCVVDVLPDGSSKENWGRRFFFNDLVNNNGVPAFFEAVKMGMGSAHSNKG